ncbi:hypothetical protein [Bradyrhizobium sp. ARR65]|uniref:hypothetical protein n=1 Tax=Bradyrhizobium sp. ARR65 TaxID=1040989 RepID=UPI001FDA30D2|nr:hypothetical protein [Bradyrhizobium sp. ARR65]
MRVPDGVSERDSHCFEQHPERNQTTMTTSDDLALLRTHANRVHRYRRLLKTPLNEMDRKYVEARLSEERRAFEALKAAIFPMTFTFRDASCKKPPSNPTA